MSKKSIYNLDAFSDIFPKEEIQKDAGNITDKDAQEHFEVLVHKRLIDIIDPSARTVDSLGNMDLPAGVSIEIKM